MARRAGPGRSRGRMALPRGASVLHLERLRAGPARPADLFARTFSRPGCSRTTCRAPGKSRCSSTWSGQPHAHHLGFVLRASQLPPSALEATGLDPALPWLLMVQLHLAADGTALLYSHDYHRGDRLSFEVLRRAEPRLSAARES